jgi:transcriptional regulator with XRE-family HTH domain
MRIGRSVRLARKHLKLSQSELAGRAGVGLATIQNIEGEHANPSINTLLAIFKVLRLKISITENSKPIDWTALSRLGCPLVVKVASSETPTRAWLLEELEGLDHSALGGREAKATAAWLSALKGHFPSVWKETPLALRAWEANQKPAAKLRRLALQRLAEFL